MIKSAVIGLVALLALSCISACGTAQDVPTVVYAGEFDNSKIDAVERVVDDVAERWQLRVFRKDRKHMSRLTFDQDAFFPRFTSRTIQSSF